MSLRYRSEALHAFGNFNAATSQSLVAAPAAGFRTAVYRLLVTVGTTASPTTFTLQDSTPAALTQAFNIGQTGGLALDVPFNYDPWWVTGNGLGVNAISGAAVPVGWDIWYLYVPAGQGSP